MEMLHRSVRSVRGEVHYWVNINDNLEAKCLVMTHGLTANHTMFDWQVAYFNDNYKVITWDVPLHGISRPYDAFSYEHTASDLKMILDQEGIDQVILIGMSMGGYPNQMFADLYPERVEKMVMIDTTPFGRRYYSQSDIFWLKRVGTLAKCFTDRYLRESMAKSVSETAAAYEKMKDMLKPLSKGEIIEQMDLAYGQFITENRDISLNGPVLLLLGDHDQTGKVKAYNQAWAKVTGYPLVMIPNARHFSNGDNPERVNREIERFIEGV